MQLATIEFMKSYADVETIIFLDWETYYKSKGTVGNKSYSLKSMTYADYILGSPFDVTGLGLADDMDAPDYIEPIEDDIERMMDEIKLRRENGERIALCAFNTGFDGAICNWRFGVHFDFYYDAQAMHVLLHNDRPHNLGSCGKDEFPNDPSMWKTDELANVDGLYFRYFSDADREGMERYGKQDVTLMRALACRYVERIIERGLEDELALMHITLRAAIEPQFVVDEKPLLERITIEEKSKLETVWAAADFLKEKFNFDDIKNIDFSSNVKFPELLEQIGIDIPMKTHKQTKKQVPALGKNDPEYVRMRIDNQRFEVIFLARDAVKSTNALTRAKKFIEVSRLFTERSKHVKNRLCNMPFFLKYHGADQTGRWSGGQKLNQQNLEADRANDGTKGHHRRSLTAPEGYQVAVSDLSNIELRVNMWFCGQNDILEQMRDKSYDYYCDVATPIFGFPVIKKEHKNERQMGKCLAEGTLVQTDAGLVPIEEVTDVHKIWDGVKYVRHEGLIYRGIKDVITYDGITATIDHPILTEQGDAIPFGVAASKMDRLMRTSGDTGKDIRRFTNCQTRHPTEEGLRRSLREVFGDTEAEMGVTTQHSEREVDVVLREREATYPECGSFGEKVRRNFAAVQSTLITEFQELRCAWDRVSFPIQNGIYSLGERELAAQGLRGDTPRPDRQRRTLRAGQPPTIDTNRKQRQPQNYPISRRLHCESTLQSDPLQQRHNSQHTRTVPDNHVRPNYSTSDRLHQRALSQLEKDGFVVEQKRVYDIINCGPRQRFVANNRLVFNCAGLGLGFAMGWPGFQQYLASGPLGMDAMFKDDEFCRNVKTSYDRKHPMVKEMWSFIEKVVIRAICQGGEIHFGPDQQFIARKDEIQLPSGRILRYPKAEYKGQETDNGFRMTTVFDSGLRTKSGAIVPKYMWFGLILENIVQATARDVLGWQKVRVYDLLESTGNGELIGSVHDETLSNLKDETVDATFSAIQSIMSSSPVWALGIPLDNEGGYAPEYSK